MLKVNIPNEAGNAAARAGMLGKTIKAILDEQKPEAVYFTDDRGQRWVIVGSVTGVAPTTLGTLHILKETVILNPTGT